MSDHARGRAAEWDSSVTSLRGPVLTGLLSLVFIGGALVAWSWLTSIASATIAPGTVVVDTSRKTIQHPDGGMVAAIRVRDGDEVSAGQVVITLDDTRLLIALRSLEPQLALNIAQEARLKAERTGERRVNFQLGDADVDLSNFPDVLEGQLKLFESRRSALVGKIAVIQSEREQAKTYVTLLQQQIGAQRVRLALTDRELDGATTLAKSGSGTALRVLQVGRARAELAGDLAGLLARAAEAEGKIQHANLEIERVQKGFLEAVETDIQQIQRERLDLLQRLDTLRDQLRRLQIAAPVDGRVVNLSVHTVGAVIAPGTPILELVPKDDPLVIEAQVRPEDIENVHPGLTVEIRLSGFDGRRLPPLLGTVSMVSADRLIDRLQGTSFFQVRVQVTNSHIEHLKGGLRPGMPVDLMIFTGEQTPIEYLTGPLARFFVRAMRS